MNPVSFLFDQLKSLSLSTELLEASDWSDKEASDSITEMRSLILKHENQCQSIEELEECVYRDLQKKNSKQKSDVLIKIFRTITDQSLDNFREETN